MISHLLSTTRSPYREQYLILTNRITQRQQLNEALKGLEYDDNPTARRQRSQLARELNTIESTTNLMQQLVELEKVILAD